MPEPEFECRSCKENFHRRKVECPKCGAPGITRLYKYVPYNENSLSILINKEVWVPKADDLNDPFEFAFGLTETHINGIPIDQDSIAESRKQTLEFGAFCLTELNNNILMWSHYSAQHQGFCIEFERSNDNDLGGDTCLPVIYPDSDDIPRFEIADIQSPKAFAKIATTKSKLWKYEAEWRVISRDGGMTLCMPGKLTAVIFGLRMDVVRRNTIRNILGDSVDYYEARADESKYQLNIDPLSDDNQQ